MIFSGSDFNVKSQIMRLHQSFGKSHHASGQTRLFSSHGLSSHDYFSSLRCQAQRRSQGQRLLLLQPVLGDVFCSTHISRIASRHRNEFESTRGKVLSSWLSMFEHFSQHIVQCQRNSPLAHLRRFCAALDRTCPTHVCKRSACYRFGRDGLRIRRHYDRSLLVGLPLGTVSNDQSGGEDAYALGSSRLHTHFRSYFRWKDSRSQHLGSLDHRANYLMDRGYLDFARLYVIHQAQAFFVTRAKSNTKFKRRYSHPVDRENSNIICDQTGVMPTFYFSYFLKNVSDLRPLT